MEAINVTPQKWTDTLILFDDANWNYSIILGTYENERTLGVRWRGADNERGYPGQGEHPTWYREPDFLIMPILNAIREDARNDPNKQQFVTNIEQAIIELS